MSDRNLAERYSNATKTAKEFALRLLPTLVALALACVLFILQYLKIGIIEDWTIILENFGLLFILFFIINQLQYNNGRTKGELQEDFRNVVKRHENEVSALSDSQLTRLSEFCEYLRVEEIKNQRVKILKNVCISYKDYVNREYEKLTINEIKNRTELTKLQQIAVKKANKISYKGLVDNDILFEKYNKTNDASYSLGMSKVELSIKFLICNTIKKIITVLFFAIFTVEELNGFNWESFAWFILQVILMFLTALGSYIKGYNDITQNLKNRTLKKIYLLHKFKVWYNENNDKEFEINDNRVETTKSVDNAT